MDVLVERYDRKQDKWIPVQIDTSKRPASEVMHQLNRFVSKGLDVRVSVMKR